MTLIDEVKTAFDEQRDDFDGGPIAIVQRGDEEMAPGFNGMRLYYEQRLLAITRRAYRHFAGGTLTQNADELLSLTAGQMVAPLVAMEMQAFTDGVLIGHRDDHQVKLSYHFHLLDELYSDETFRETSGRMATGFAGDSEVLGFFAHFTNGGVEHLSHITGFAHRRVDPRKVWDIWLLIGTAVSCSCYLAGYRMGTAWRERDVLTGIEIATEEEPRGSERED